MFTGTNFLLELTVYRHMRARHTFYNNYTENLPGPANNHEISSLPMSLQ